MKSINQFNYLVNYHSCTEHITVIASYLYTDNRKQHLKTLGYIGIFQCTYSLFHIDSHNDCNKPPPCKRLFRAQELIPMVLEESQSPETSNSARNSSSSFQ